MSKHTGTHTRTHTSTHTRTLTRTHAYARTRCARHGLRQIFSVASNAPTLVFLVVESQMWCAASRSKVLATSKQMLYCGWFHQSA